MYLKEACPFSIPLSKKKHWKINKYLFSPLFHFYIHVQFKARGPYINHLLYVIYVMGITIQTTQNMWPCCKWNLNDFFTLFLSSFSEIGKVRGNLFQINGKKNEPLVLPDAVGTSTSLSEKVYVPIKEYPDVSAFMLDQPIFSFKTMQFWLPIPCIDNVTDRQLFTFK